MASLFRVTRSIATRSNAARFTTAPSTRLQQNRTFISTPQFLLKESNRDSPDHDKHKQDSLQAQKDGKGQWKPELASDSEEAIAADREGKNKNEGVEELQRRTEGKTGEKK